MYRSKLIGALLVFAVVLAACSGSPLDVAAGFQLDQLQEQVTDELTQEVLQDLTAEQQECVNEILAGADPATLPPDWYLACFEIEVPDLATIAIWTAQELEAFLGQFPQETVDACVAASVSGSPEEIVACVLAANGLEVPQDIQDIIDDPVGALEDLVPPIPDLADIANWTEQELDAFLGQFPQEVVDACKASVTSGDPVDIVTCVLGANGVPIPDLANITNWSQQELDNFLSQFPPEVVAACEAATTSGSTVDIVECVLGANGIPIPDPVDVAIWTIQELEAFLSQFPQEVVDACIAGSLSGDTAEIVNCVLGASEIDIPEGNHH